MDVLAFREVGYVIIGLILVMMMLLTLVSVRKEQATEEPLRGLLWLTVLMLCLCAFVALSSAYISARSLQKPDAPAHRQVVITHNALPQ